MATVAVAAVLVAADSGPRPAAPRINVGGIVNAASNIPAPDNYISPGALVSIYGTGLANATREAREADLIEGRVLPLTLASVSVYFGSGAGVATQGRLLYVSPSQINVQAPVELLPGEWNVSVRLNSLESSERIPAREFSPGLFAVARHIDGVAVSREAPARAGEWILFYGTGYGSFYPYLRTGQLAPLEPWWMPYPIEAKIGETQLTRSDIYYWGLAPGYAGLFQFNLRIPVNTLAGDPEVRVKVAEEWSQPGMRIAVTR